MRVCSVDGCDGVCKARGLCSKHYQRLRNHGSPTAEVQFKSPPGQRPPCSVAGCARTSVARGWCYLHYDRWRATGDVRASDPPIGTGRTTRCVICGLPTKTRQWCQRHYDKWKNHGDPLYERQPAPQARCTVDGCDQLVVARGVCNRHYRRWSVHGDPEAPDMRAQCSACAHPQRFSLDAAILSGATLPELSSRYGLSTSVLSNHKRSHVGLSGRPPRCMVCRHPDRALIEQLLADRDLAGNPRGSLVAIERQFDIPSLTLLHHHSVDHAAWDARSAAERLGAVRVWAS